METLESVEELARRVEKLSLDLLVAQERLEQAVSSEERFNQALIVHGMVYPCISEGSLVPPHLRDEY
jgi:uncharacterized membrane protein YjjP (DUF1212 family)